METCGKDKQRVKGERKLWAAYLLWFTVVGHRWYLGKISPVYVLTLGYFGAMWMADLFRLPAMVRGYNTFVYQRSAARDLAVATGVSPSHFTSAG
jgi:hypothetical protein